MLRHDNPTYEANNADLEARIQIAKLRLHSKQIQDDEDEALKSRQRRKSRRKSFREIIFPLRSAASNEKGVQVQLPAETEYIPVPRSDRLDVVVVFLGCCNVSADWCRYFKRLFANAVGAFDGAIVETLFDNDDGNKDATRVADAAAQILILGPDLLKWRRSDRDGDLLEQLLKPKRLLTLLLGVEELEARPAFPSCPFRSLGVEGNSAQFARRVFDITLDTLKRHPNPQNASPAKASSFRVIPDSVSVLDKDRGFFVVADGGIKDVEIAPSQLVQSRFEVDAFCWRVNLVEASRWKPEGETLQVQVGFEAHRSKRDEAVRLHPPRRDLSRLLRPTFAVLEEFDEKAISEESRRRIDAKLLHFVRDSLQGKEDEEEEESGNDQDKAFEEVLQRCRENDFHTLLAALSPLRSPSQKPPRPPPRLKPNEAVTTKLADVESDAKKVDADYLVPKSSTSNYLPMHSSPSLAPKAAIKDHDEHSLSSSASSSSSSEGNFATPAKKMNTENKLVKSELSGSAYSTPRPQSRQEIIKSIRDLSQPSSKSAEGGGSDNGFVAWAQENVTHETTEEEEEDEDVLDMVGFRHEDVVSPSKKATSESSTASSHFESCQEELIELQEQFKKDLISLQEVEEKFESWKRRPEIHRLRFQRQEELEQMRDEWLRLQQLAEDRNKKESHVWQLLRGGLTRIRRKTLNGTDSPNLSGAEANTTVIVSTTTKSEKQRRRSHCDRSAKAKPPALLPRVASHAGTFTSTSSSSSNPTSKSIFYDFSEEDYAVPRQLSPSAPLTPPKRVDSLLAAEGAKIYENVGENAHV